MEDPQRQPKDSDRSLVAGRIKRASDEGRISGADRDIRLGNVWNAQTMAELELMTRELDQLDATPLPAPTAATEKPWSKFDPAPGDDDEVSDTVTRTSTPPGAGSRVALVSVVVAVAVLIAAVALFLNFRGTGAVDVGPAVDPAGQAPPSGVPPSQPGGRTTGAKYALTEPGIRGFLQSYQMRFGTTRVVDLTLFGDYAVVNVPVPGKARQAGWIYRDASGFTTFGAVRAVIPGTRTIDTNRLDLAALVRNIARAKATLKVEEPAQTYVIVRSTGRVDVVPSVNVYQTNEFSESGYLATRLDGKVERAFPYGP